MFLLLYLGLSNCHALSSVLSHSFLIFYEVFLVLLILALLLVVMNFVVSFHVVVTSLEEGGEKGAVC